MRRAYFQTRTSAMLLFDSLWASGKWAYLEGKPGYYMVNYY